MDGRAEGPRLDAPEAAWRGDAGPGDRRPEEVAPARLAVVLCPGRSGSTLLSVMLGAHSRVLAPAELHLLRFEDFDAWRRDYRPAVQSLLEAYRALGAPLDEAALAHRFGGAPVGAVYRDLLARLGPGCLLVDKTPAYARYEDALARAETLEPLYLWLVRHPLGVASSRIESVRARERSGGGARARLLGPLHALEGLRRRWSRRELRRALARWVDSHERIERFLARLPAERWRRLHYEVLVREPGATLERLAAWLGLDPEPGMLDPRAHVPAALAWGVGNEKVRQHPGIDASVADRWRSRYREAQLDARTRAVMERLGVARAAE